MNASRAWVSVCVVVGLLAGLCGTARATPVGITVLSQTHHVWGHASGYDPAIGWFANPYDSTDTAPVSGTASAPHYVPGHGWGTNTVSSQAGDCLVQAQDGSWWTFTGSAAYAQSNYVFAPNTYDLSLQFDGSVEMHAFENRVMFSLTDVTDGIQIDTHTWTTENYLHVDYHRDYVCDPSHHYELVLFAKVNIGDSPGAISLLQVGITPEPATLSLLALGGLALMRRRRR